MRGWFGESYRHSVVARRRAYLKPKLLIQSQAQEPYPLKNTYSNVVLRELERRAAEREAAKQMEIPTPRPVVIRKAPDEFEMEFIPETGAIVAPRGERISKDPRVLMEKYGVTRDEARMMIAEAKEREREVRLQRGEL